MSPIWPDRVKARRKLLAGVYINGRMREMKKAPNPNGREGNPSLHPLKPADALKGLMMVKPEPKAEAKPKPRKKAATLRKKRPTTIIKSKSNICNN